MDSSSIQKMMMQRVTIGKDAASDPDCQRSLRSREYLDNLE